MRPPTAAAIQHAQHSTPAQRSRAEPSLSSRSTCITRPPRPQSRLIEIRHTPCTNITERSHPRARRACISRWQTRHAYSPARSASHGLIRAAGVRLGRGAPADRCC
eukprot:6295306-Prymnesium_polylepis.3